MTWKRFLSDLSKAMLMTDPLAYGLYLGWASEPPGRGDSDVAPLPAHRRKPDSLLLARRVG